jgi:hypothetical protein
MAPGRRAQKKRVACFIRQHFGANNHLHGSNILVSASQNLVDTSSRPSALLIDGVRKAAVNPRALFFIDVRGIFYELPKFRVIYFRAAKFS